MTSERTLQYFNLEFVGGTLEIESNIEEGKGYGSSTADCIAAAAATAQAVGRSLTEEQTARIVVDAEVASDNFMFQRAVVFAHREGVVLEELGARIPTLDVLGMDTDANGFIDTLDYSPAEYSKKHMEDFQTMAAALRRAIQTRDLPLIGRVATASSIVNQQFLPKPLFAEVLRISEFEGALGISVAHSGTTLALLLDPNDCHLKIKLERIHRNLSGLGIKRIMNFRTSHHGGPGFQIDFNVQA